ncbi:hypothetical protein FRB94_008447 [Tulasnella sp. JGI-2019a]|nr:hypothetical protein FRB94_008447 [Tulasnella sp. JGI-2019a]
MSESASQTATVTLRTLVDVLDGLPIPPPFKDAVLSIPKISLTIMEISEGVRKNKDDAKELARYIADLTDATFRPLTGVGDRSFSPAMAAAVNDFHEALHQVEIEMLKLASRNLWKRIINYNEDSVTVAAFKDRIEDARRIIQTEISIATLALVEDVNAIVTETHGMVEHTAHVVSNTNYIASRTQSLVVDTNAVARATHSGVVSLEGRFEDDNMRRLLNQLGTGGSSAANASGVEECICTPRTREVVLARIERWITEPEYNEKHIMWLKALAGSGKTAVAGSVEKMAKISRRLGARFYFARGQTERNARCILEISRQLASLSERMLRDSIVMAIQEDPDIITSPAVLQYQKLILEPLLTLVDTDLKLIIVIDAVDECEEEYATKLLELIGRDHHRLPIGVKFFVTSRVEPHIQSELEDESVFPTVEQLSLDEEGSSTVQKDIVLYLKGRLPALVKKFGIKDKDWPGEPARMELARMAGESFIWAATAVLLVADPNYRNPVARLEHILSTPSLKNLDYLYSSALSHAFPSIIDQPVLSLLRDMLGMLVVARTPLSLVTLASLMSSTTDSPQVMAEKIREQILNYLGSVLTVSDGDNVGNSKPIQFLHKSFVDFLTTKGRCDDRFLLHIPEQHEKMASRCLQRLNGLERNICQLTDPSKLNSEVSDLNERIHRHIPYALQYASEHWADHITKITVDRGVKTEIDLLFEVFMARVLLFWIELMGLLGKAKEAVLLVRLAETWVTARGKRINFDPSLLPLVRDAKRFIMGFMEPISTSSLHIYISALAFTPTNSHLLATYGNLLTAGPKLLRCRDAEWSSCLWAGSKHSGYVTCLAVTPDGKTIASGSRDRALRLWDVRTGAPIGGPLHGHTGGVTCVSWSPNGKVLLSGSDDNTLRLWDGEIGVAIGGALVGHTGGITCLSWASDGKRLVSASTDGTLRLWDADTGGDIVTLEGHNGGVTCLAFSTDGQTVVSGSEDWTLTLWDVATSKAIHQLKGHEDKINCLAWPPNGKILASGSADHTLRLWNTETGSSVKKLEQGDEVNCLAFSPNGKTLGFAVGNSGLFLLDAETGADVGEPLKGHTDKITCLRFSPDSKVLASGSRDETLRLWDTATGLAIGGALEGHSDEINCLAFAPNGKTLASGADDYTLRLWDLNTEVPVQEPSDNLALVWCLAFAPGGKTLVTGSMDSTIRF